MNKGLKATTFDETELTGGVSADTEAPRPTDALLARYATPPHTGESSLNITLILIPIGLIFIFLMFCRLTASSVQGTVLSTSTEENFEEFGVSLPNQLLEGLFWAMSVSNGWSALGAHSKRLYETSKEILTCFRRKPHNALLQDRAINEGIGADGELDTEPVSHALASPATNAPRIARSMRRSTRWHITAQASNLIFSGLNGLNNYYSMRAKTNFPLAITVGIGYGLITLNFGYRFIRDYFNPEESKNVVNTHPKTAGTMLGFGIITQLSIFYFFLSRVLQPTNIASPGIPLISVAIALLTLPAMYVSQADKSKTTVSQLMKYLCTRPARTETERKAPSLCSSGIVTTTAKGINYSTFKIGELLTILMYISSNWLFFRELFGVNKNLAGDVILGILALPTGLAGATIYISNNLLTSEKTIGETIDYLSKIQCRREGRRCRLALPVAETLQQAATSPALPESLPTTGEAK